MATDLNDGDKAAKMRNALRAALDQIPDTAHEPRHAVRLMLNMPAIVLAVVFDAIKGEG